MLDWFFKPKPIISRQPVKVAILFSERPYVSHYLLSEIESDSNVSDAIKIVAAISNIASASKGLFKMKRIECKILDEKTFMKKHASAQNPREKYFEWLASILSTLSPNIVVSDFFPADSIALEKILKVPVLDVAWASIEGSRIVTLFGRNCVRDAILASKRELQAGIFLTFNGTKNLLVLSKPLQLDLKRLSEISTSDEFEKYVNMFFEKFIWICAGPAMLMALKLIASASVAFKENKLYIGNDKQWLHGFYNMLTEHAQSYLGLTS